MPSKPQKPVPAMVWVALGWGASGAVKNVTGDLGEPWLYTILTVGVIVAMVATFRRTLTAEPPLREGGPVPCCDRNSRGHACTHKER